MTSITTEPITAHWTPADLDSASAVTTVPSATAAHVSSLLAQRDVSDIADETLPLLAASAAELALVAGISWRFSTDDPAVALLRIFARATLRSPGASGPHTERLALHLSR